MRPSAIGRSDPIMDQLAGERTFVVITEKQTNKQTNKHTEFPLVDLTPPVGGVQ